MGFSFGYGFKRRSYIFYQKGRNFFSTQWAGGVVLLFFVVVAMLLANKFNLSKLDYLIK